MGLVQAENIQVIGEAYDVALDISFPKGINYHMMHLFKLLFQMYLNLLNDIFLYEEATITWV